MSKNTITTATTNRQRINKIKQSKTKKQTNSNIKQQPRELKQK